MTKEFYRSTQARGIAYSHQVMQEEYEVSKNEYPQGP
jgi:hypothetical protein